MLPGLTAAVSAIADLFLDAGDEMVLPDLSWPNYRLIIEERKDAKCVTYPTFTPRGAPRAAGQGYNVAGLEAELRASALRAKSAGKTAKAACILNFPNNPTGYTPTLAEADAIVAALVRVASEGVALLVLVDDAYFGLQYEDGLLAESIFARVAWAHPNILAVKADGPTKEDYVWGFRVGFITFGVKGGTPALYQALEAKCAGAIRANISNASMPAQSMLLAAWKNPAYAVEKQQAYNTLKTRYQEIQRVLAAHPEYREAFVALPYNSGYFMCVKPCHADPEKVRQKLLTDHSTGVISLCGILRIAFSATPLTKIEPLFASLYQACKAV